MKYEKRPGVKYAGPLAISIDWLTGLLVPAWENQRNYRPGVSWNKKIVAGVLHLPLQPEEKPTKKYC